MTLESPPPLLCAACRQPAPGGTLPGARCPADDALFIDAVDAVQRPDDPWLGQTIGGKYALFGIIGVGGFGAVYRAVQAPVGRIVAVKVIRPQLDASSQDTLRARFFREAKVVARLADPAIVTLYDYGEAPDGRLYMVFEYIDGTPLSAVLRSGPIEPARVAPLLHQILGALALAHRLGCVHRDLKPGNVMLTRSPFGEDIAKVLDFGIAKVTVSGEVEHSLQSSLETREGVVVGTPKYMAPEQARGLEIDGRADLYALGCLGYAMLTGRPPFDDASAVDVLMAQVSRSVPPFPEHLGVPAPLAAVLYRALSKSPNDRFATAEEMARALATFTPGLTGTRETVAATPSTPTNVSMPSATLVASPVRDADWPEAGTSREFASTIAPATSSPATSAPATSAPAATGTASAFDGRRGFFAAMAVGLVATVGWAALRPAPGPTEPDAAAPPLPQSPPVAAAPTTGTTHAAPWPMALAAAARRDDIAAASAVLEAIRMAEQAGPGATADIIWRIEREPALAQVRLRPEVASRLRSPAPAFVSASPTPVSTTAPPTSSVRTDHPTPRVTPPRSAPARATTPPPAAASTPASRLAVPEF
jgi:serine/threonine protein kinase